MSEFRLLATDLDGTLANSSHELSATTVSTLLAAQERGLRIALCSGRPTYGMSPIAECLRLSDFGGYVISYNGGQTIEWSTGCVLQSHTLPVGITASLYRLASDAGLDIVCYMGDRVVSENTSNPYIRLLSERNGMRLEQVPSFIESTRDVALPKCLIVGEPEALVGIEHSHGLPINAFRSDPFLLELVPLGIDKGACLSDLADHLDLQRHEVMACGDGLNDITMIQYAGLGIAMANAHPIVKAAADLITLSNDEDGVAAVVARLV